MSPLRIADLPPRLFLSLRTTLYPIIEISLSAIVLSKRVSLIAKISRVWPLDMTIFMTIFYVPYKTNNIKCRNFETFQRFDIR